MSPKFRSLSLALFTAAAFASGAGALLAACGNNSNSSSTAAEQPTTPSNGELSGLYAQMKSSPGWQGQGCDSAFEAPVREMLADLDGHAAKTAATSVKMRQDRARASKGSIDVIDFGGVFVLHDKTPAQPKHNGWSSQSRGWAAVLDEYRALKKKPSEPGWVSLDRDARTVLDYDARRLINGDNMAIQQSDQPGLQSLLGSYEDCLADTTCTEPKLDADGKQEIESNPYFIEMSHALHEAPNTAAKRDVIQKALVERLRRDAAPFVARADRKAVTRLSSNQIEVALDPGTAVTTNVGLDRAASAISAIWSSASLSVHVRWAQSGSPAAPGAFRLMADPAPDNSIAVSYPQRQILIPSGRSDRALGFAIGRVLGFGSHAFVNFNPTGCTYVVSGNDLDIMSTYSTGTVTADEWQDLDKLYPLETDSKKSR